MARFDPDPGPDAGEALRLGTIAAAVVALAGLAALYRYGFVSAPVLVFALLVMFPVYLVVVASALSVWLGLGKDASDLRPVYRERDGS